MDPRKITETVDSFEMDLDGSKNPIEAWRDYNSQLLRLIESTGKNPEDYHVIRNSSYGPGTMDLAELSDEQEKLLEEQKQRWDEYDLTVEVKLKGKNLKYEADPSTIINPKVRNSEEEFLAKAKKPPSSVRLTSDEGPDLRLRILRDYQPELYDRINQSIHHDFEPFDKSKRIEHGESSFVSEVDLYRTFWSLEGDNWFESYDLTNLMHPEHIIVDYTSNSDTPMVNEELAMVYPEFDNLRQVEFNDDVIEEISKILATEEVLGITFSDIDWEERIYTFGEVSNFDMEFPVANLAPSYDQYIFQSKIYSNMSEDQEEDVGRSKKDKWANEADEIYSEVREQAETEKIRLEFVEEFNTVSGGLTELPESRNFV